MVYVKGGWSVVVSSRDRHLPPRLEQRKERAIRWIRGL